MNVRVRIIIRKSMNIEKRRYTRITMLCISSVDMACNPASVRPEADFHACTPYVHTLSYRMCVCVRERESVCVCVRVCQPFPGYVNSNPITSAETYLCKGCSNVPKKNHARKLCGMCVRPFCRIAQVQCRRQRIWNRQSKIMNIMGD
jgi:hypothetical protein